jgi:hypothetical protein
MQPRGVVVGGEPSIFEAGNPKINQKINVAPLRKKSIFLNSQPYVETPGVLSALNLSWRTSLQGLWTPLPGPLLRP